MALTKPALTVTWSTSGTGSLSAGSSLSSDEFTPGAADVSAEIICIATTSTTDSAFYISFFLLGGDGTSWSSAGTDGERMFLAKVYCAATSTTYRSRPVSVPLGLLSYKIHTISGNGGSDATTVSVYGKKLNVA